MRPRWRSASSSSSASISGTEAHDCSAADLAHRAPRRRVARPAAGRQPRQPQRAAGPESGAGDLGRRVPGDAAALVAVRSGERRLPVRRAARLDSDLRHPVLRGHRRHQPAPDRAHRLPDADRPAVVVGVGPHEGAGVLGLHPAARSRHDRRLRIARSVPVLRVLGRDAHPDVLPHRDLGLRPARVRRGEVHPLHDGRQRADAGGDPRPGLHAPRGDRQLQLRPAAAVRPAPAAADAVLVLPGVHGGLRDQGAAVPVPHLAARRARPGADGRLGRSWPASC